MAGESVGSPARRCSHTRGFQKVLGTEEPDGSYQVMCPECNETRKTRPARMEQSRDSRPLIVE